MTLRFMDSFDHWAITDFYEKWEYKYTSGDINYYISEGVGRRGTNCLSMLYNNGYGYGIISTDVPSNNTYIVGVAIKITDLIPSINPDNGERATGIELRESGSTQVVIQIWPDGSIKIARSVQGTAIIDSSATGVITAGQWYYIEFKATIHNTTGIYEVRVNGVNVCSGTDADTQNTGNATIDSVRLWGNSRINGNDILFDDLYICDDLGSVNNDFLGDVAVEVSLPNDVGNQSQWTPTSGSNFENVDESTPDDDTTTIKSSTVDEYDTYEFANSGSPGEVLAVQVLLNAKKNDAGYRSLKAVTRPVSTDYDGGDELSIGDDYSYYAQIWENNPETSSPWTTSELDAAEFGVKVEA